MKRNLILIILALFGSIFSPTLVTKVEVEHSTAVSSKKVVKTLSLVHTAQAQYVVHHHDRIKPLYSTLSNIELILDATGLRTSTDNTYGTLSNNSVQVWKSIAPGPTGRDFSAGGVGPSSTGSPGQWLDGYVQLGGALRYVHGTSSVWNFLHYNAAVANLKWTVHIVMKLGKESNSDWTYGILGNNASSAGNRGIHARFEDRSSRINGLSTNIAKGSAGFILEANPDNIVTQNTPFVLTIETDMNLAAADRQKFYINGTQFPYTTTSTSTAVVSGPTFNLDIGAIGNGSLPLHGWISHVVLQSGIESSGVRDAFIQSLIPYTINKGSMTYNVDESRTYSNNSFLSESIYYLNTSVIRSPTTGAVLTVFGNWTSTGHSYHEDSYAAFRKSTDNGKTFATKAPAFNPGDDIGVIDLGAFYDNSGIVHGFANTMDGAGATSTSGTSKLWYFTSSDDGSNWANQQITVPSDGLTFTAAYGNGYTSDGYNFFCLYRQNNTATSSAVYVLRWPVGGNIATDLQWKLVLSGATYINEGSIARTGANSHVIVLRNESTLEWTQARTSNNWDNVTVDGDLTFGESNTVAGPVRMTMIKVNRNGILHDVLACYYPKRGTPNLNVIYANPANAASGVNMWDNDTKVVITTDTEIIHYGGIYQIDYSDGNGPTFNYLAVYTREVVASPTSTLIYFNGPTNHYSRTLTELGL